MWTMNLAMSSRFGTSFANHNSRWHRRLCTFNSGAHPAEGSCSSITGASYTQEVGMTLKGLFVASALFVLFVLAGSRSAFASCTVVLTCDSGQSISCSGTYDCSSTQAGVKCTSISSCGYLCLELRTVTRTCSGGGGDEESPYSQDYGKAAVDDSYIAN
jgi:hypothetical protein